MRTTERDASFRCTVQVSFDIFLFYSICCLSTLNIVQIIGISHNETKVKLGKKLKSQQSCDTVPLKGGVGGVI